MRTPIWPAKKVAVIGGGSVAIDGYLRGESLLPEPPEPVLTDIEDPAFKFHLRETSKEERHLVSALPVKNRKGNFKEVNLGFADKEA